MIYPSYQGRPLVPTKSAYREMEDLGINMFDIADVLENGYDCSRGKREKGKLERCLHIDNKVTRVVADIGQFGYPDGYIEDVYWVIHVSITTYRKRR